jgi:putative transcriptional regulator
MTKTNKPKPQIKPAIPEIATGLHAVGMIDKQTMRRFDDSCLTPIPQFSATQIRALRDREDVSQPVFASYLNVTKDSVSKWERGEKKPAGPSLKLLSLVERKGLAGIA